LSRTRILHAMIRNPFCGRRHVCCVVRHALVMCAVVVPSQAAIPNVVGIRMIQNYHATDPTLTWPQVERGDYWSDPAFFRAFELMLELGLSFDLQLNPHQMLDAAAFFAHFPGVPVVLNHLGCPKYVLLLLTRGPSLTCLCVARLNQGADKDAVELETWRSGMAALAALPSVHVKLSGFCYVKSDVFTNPDAEAQVKALVLQVIEWFGSSRCLFASNFPVDKLDGTPLITLVTHVKAWLADLPSPMLADIFHGTATKLYRL
jgi:predicted TIM-barrel fold metal-dependent hydrolase